jgi:hypothetical protein
LAGVFLFLFFLVCIRLLLQLSGAADHRFRKSLR